MCSIQILKGGGRFLPLTLCRIKPCIYCPSNSFDLRHRWATIACYSHDAHTRLADLHRTMNVHTKPSSVTGDDEGAWLGAWPSGRMVGKKGDILKLVSQSSNTMLCALCSTSDKLADLLYICIGYSVNFFHTH